MNSWISVEGKCLAKALTKSQDSGNIADAWSWHDVLREAEADPSAQGHYIEWLSRCDPGFDLAGRKLVYQHLKSAAERLLEPQTHDFFLRAKPDDNAGERIVIWRSISASVPTLTLCAAHSKGPDNDCARVKLLTPSIAPIGPVAILHVHYGQMYDFAFIRMVFGI
jgi:hypothetical protein